MANFRTILSFLQYTPSATQEAAGFPATNLTDVRHPLRPWKATADNVQVDVTLDFGWGNIVSVLASDPGVFINPLNFTSARLQGNNVTTNWTTPPWDQPITIGQDQWNGRHKGLWRLADLNAAAFTYRYLNIRIPPQASLDAAPYRIGGIAVGQIKEWTTNPPYGIDRTRVDLMRENRMADGGAERAKLGEPHVMLAYPRKLASAAALSEQLDVLGLGLDQPFVLWDASLGNGSQNAYLVYRAELMPVQHQSFTFHTGTLTLKEVI